MKLPNQIGLNISKSFDLFLHNNKGNKGCWEWNKSKDKDGYGRTKCNGKTSIAHRAAYRHLIGSIEKGKILCHKCDNPPCCNPTHLFIGTPKDNYEDSRRKGRSCVGEKNGCGKLTALQVLSIRADTRRQVDIAAEYGIRQTTVSAIKTRQNWRHL